MGKKWIFFEVGKKMFRSQTILARAAVARHFAPPPPYANTLAPPLTNSLSSLTISEWQNHSKITLGQFYEKGQHLSRRYSDIALMSSSQLLAAVESDLFRQWATVLLESLPLPLVAASCTYFMVTSRHVICTFRCYVQGKVAFRI